MLSFPYLSIVYSRRQPLVTKFVCRAISPSRSTKAFFRKVFGSSSDTKRRVSSGSRLIFRATFLSIKSTFILSKFRISTIFQYISFYFYRMAVTLYPTIINKIIRILQLNLAKNVSYQNLTLLNPQVVSGANHAYKQQSPAVAGLSMVWRRVRDSNPRSYYRQRFSRPPHSTTLPTLRRKSTNSMTFCKFNSIFFDNKFTYRQILFIEQHC